jgi:hypothetical protein
MNKLFTKPLHLVTIVILIAVGGLYWYAHSQQERYDEAASAWLRGAMADIASWQGEALQRQLAPEALAAIDQAHIEALVARYRVLGGFVAMSDVQFGTLTAALSAFSGDTLLSYSGQVKFQNGSAHFTATLVHRDDRFRFYNLNFGEPQMRVEGTTPQP